MKFRKISCALMAVTATIVLCSCESTKSTQGKDSPESQKTQQAQPGNVSAPAPGKGGIGAVEDKELLPLAEQYLDSIIVGMKDKNYNNFIQYQVEERRQTITKEKFKQMIEALDKEKGSYKGRSYIGSMTKGVFKVFVWKAQYAKIDKSKKEVSDDVLVTLILGYVDSKYQIFGVSFQ